MAGFEIDAFKMALSANQIETENILANQRASSTHQICVRVIPFPYLTI